MRRRDAHKKLARTSLSHLFIQMSDSKYSIHLISQIAINSFMWPASQPASLPARPPARPSVRPSISQHIKINSICVLTSRSVGILLARTLLGTKRKIEQSSDWWSEGRANQSGKEKREGGKNRKKERKKESPTWICTCSSWLNSGWSLL